MTDGTALDAGPARPRQPRRGRSRPHHLATAAGLHVLRAAGSAVDAAIATNAVLGVVMPSGCGLGGDAFWLIWDEATGRQSALNGSGRAPAAADAGGAARPRARALPLRGPLSDHRARRRPLVGRRPCPPRPAVARRRSSPRRSSWHATASRPRTGSSRRSRARRRAVAEATRRRTPGSSRSTGRTAARGDRASASGCRRWRRRSSTLADDGFDAFYDGDLGERQARGLAAAGCADPRRRPARTHARPGASRSGSTTAASGSRRIHPTAPGIVALELLGILERFEPPAGDGLRAGRRDRCRAGSTSGSRRPSWPWRTATPTSPTRAFRDVPVDALLDPRTRPTWPRGSTRPRGRVRRPPRTPRRRHDLPRHGRRRGQCGQPHRVELPGVRVGRRRSGDRDPLPEPGQLLQPGRRPPQRPRAGQADAPHAAPRDAVPGPGEARPVDRGRLDGRRRPAADPRPVRGRRRRWRGGYPDRGGGAALVRRAGRTTSRRRPTVHLEPRHAPGDRPRRWPPSATTSCRRRRSTAALATSTRSSSSTAARRRPMARWPPRRTRAARGCPPSGEPAGSPAAPICDTRRPVAGCAHTRPPPAPSVAATRRWRSP